MTIHVGKAGVFAGAAHEHWVDAPIATGMIDGAATNPAVSFSIESSQLTVRPEKGVSDSDQAAVQSNMQHKVLETSRYPRIVFQSTHVQRTGENAWRVAGELKLHGVTRTVIVDVTRENEAYVGAVRIKQTDFEIQPVKLGGGLVKVKDELEITFHVYTVGPHPRAR